MSEFEGRVSYRCGKCFALIGGPEGPNFCGKCLEYLKNRIESLDNKNKLTMLELCGKLDLGFYLVASVWSGYKTGYDLNTMLSPEQIQEICSDLLCQA